MNIRLTLLCLAITASARAEVRVAGVFSDHMVLQRDRPTPFSPASGPATGSFNGLHRESNFLAFHNNPCDDHRFHNNIFVQRPDLSGFNLAKTPVPMHGNVYLGGAKPSQHEADPLLFPQADTRLDLVHASDGWTLTFAGDSAWREAAKSRLVTTESLGNALVPNQPFTNPDGSPLKIDTDYFGKKRDTTNPFPGPFEKAVSELQKIKVWPK